MLTLRNLLPTDLVALAAFYARPIANQAQQRAQMDGNAEGALQNLGGVLEQWVTAENRKAIVAVEGLTAIRGLLTARQRDGRSVWEIDRLMVEDEDAELSRALLEELADRLSESAARRIFLRLPLESASMTAAKTAGFFPYVSETLFQRTSIGKIERPEEKPLPAGKKQDVSHRLFRLYCTAAPTEVQMKEGPTLEEWLEAREPSFGREREYFWAENGQPWAWLRTTEHDQTQHITLLADPSAEDAFDGLVRYALSLAPRSGKTLALVPDYQLGLHRVLTEDWGFEEVAHFAALVRQLTVRVRAGQLVPARS